MQRALFLVNQGGMQRPQPTVSYSDAQGVRYMMLGTEQQRCQASWLDRMIGFKWDVNFSLLLKSCVWLNSNN